MHNRGVGSRAPPVIIQDSQIEKKDFKQWLKNFDQNGDGKISQQEIRDGLQKLGVNCTRWKAWRAMVHADLNHNKHIDGDAEIEELIKYAVKSWGFVVV